MKSMKTLLAIVFCMTLSACWDEKTESSQEDATVSESATVDETTTATTVGGDNTVAEPTVSPSPAPVGGTETVTE